MSINFDLNNPIPDLAIYKRQVRSIVTSCENSTRKLNKIQETAYSQGQATQSALEHPG